MELKTMESARIPLLDRHRESLGKAFEKYLKIEVGIDNPGVLSVGCGAGDEAEPILRIFPNAKYKGIDSSESDIELASRLNDDLPKTIFGVADARNKDSFTGGPWDVIILRNPQITETLSGLKAFLENKAKIGKYWEPIIKNKVKVSKDWELIIKNSIDSLREGGIMFITTSSEDEREMILDQLGTSDRTLKILVNEENKYKTTSEAFNDDLVILAKKTVDNI